MRILVTGGTGFVGRELLLRLAQSAGTTVRATVRGRTDLLPAGVEPVFISELSPGIDWSEGLRGVDIVVHLAARVHAMRDRLPDPLAVFRRVNVESTLALARAADAAGVRRFVFLSSIKVNGERTEPGKPFTCHDAPKPRNAYAVSKLEAEQGLARIAAASPMEFVVIRPPLVYGPGVGANFRSMMLWVRRGVPLPLGLIHNQRSLVARANLGDLIARCLDHPDASNRVLMVSDGEDLSTTELLRRLGRMLNRRARLVPVPAALLKLCATVVGQRDVALRLCDSLQVDIAPTRRLLGWSPPLSVDRALQETASDFLRTQ
jgi:nucleoside-diphosphate-sugar epimerase